VVSPAAATHIPASTPTETGPIRGRLIRRLRLRSEIRVADMRSAGSEGFMGYWTRGLPDRFRLRSALIISARRGISPGRAHAKTAYVPAYTQPRRRASMPAWNRLLALRSCMRRRI
jgi:hypothetical protein